MDVENTQRHHVYPVSIYGETAKYNLIDLKSQTHYELHRILDIHPSIFGKMTRKIREKTNHKILLSPDDIQMRGDMQNMFFDRIDHLPKYVQQEHVKKGLERLSHYNKVYTDITGDILDAPQKSQNLKDKFFEIHACTLQAQKEISNTISLIIKKHRR